MNGDGYNTMVSILVSQLVLYARMNYEESFTLCVYIPVNISAHRCVGMTWQVSISSIFKEPCFSHWLE